MPSEAVSYLAIPLSPLVGWEREADAVCALLRREDVGLLTLIRPGRGGVTGPALAAATGSASIGCAEARANGYPPRSASSVHCRTVRETVAQGTCEGRADVSILERPPSA